jgi:deferrochelatase/peroxidase EfeB
MTDSGVTRRGLLQSAGIAGVGLGLGAGAGYAIGNDSDAGEGTGTVSFRGERQAGIVTAAQDRLHFAAFDVVTDSLG